MDSLGAFEGAPITAIIPVLGASELLVRIICGRIRSVCVYVSGYAAAWLMITADCPLGHANLRKIKYGGLGFEVCLPHGGATTFDLTSF
jgi:hypothetical protein